MITCGILGSSGTSGKSGKSGTSGYSPWGYHFKKDMFCPNCGSSNGRYDSDLTQFHKPDQICGDCGHICYESELLEFEQHINHERSKKLNDIL